MVTWRMMLGHGSTQSGLSVYLTLQIQQLTGQGLILLCPEKKGALHPHPPLHAWEINR